jgi:hypothetical protein
MNADRVCLTDAQFSKIELHLPSDTRGIGRRNPREPPGANQWE